MKNLLQLQVQLRKIENESREIRQQIEDLKNAKELPKLKNKYEGKFFKYLNSNPTDKWYLYSYCRQCVDCMEVLIDRFETTTYQCEFKHAVPDHYSILQTEISKEEYFEAYNKFLANLLELDVSQHGTIFTIDQVYRIIANFALTYSTDKLWDGIGNTTDVVNELKQLCDIDFTGKEINSTL